MLTLEQKEKIYIILGFQPSPSPNIWWYPVENCPTKTEDMPDLYDLTKLINLITQKFKNFDFVLVKDQFMVKIAYHQNDRYLYGLSQESLQDAIHQALLKVG